MPASDDNFLAFTSSFSKIGFKYRAIEYTIEYTPVKSSHLPQNCHEWEPDIIVEFRHVSLALAWVGVRCNKKVLSPPLTLAYLEAGYSITVLSPPLTLTQMGDDLGLYLPGL